VAIATAIEAASEPGRDSKGSSRRGGGPPKRRSISRGEAQAAARYFVGKRSECQPALEREVGSEQEALVESLKTGCSVFIITEWKAVADLSKQVPQIRKEVVRRDETPGAPAATVARSATLAQSS
jgi:hypothetical protein